MGSKTNYQLDVNILHIYKKNKHSVFFNRVLFSWSSDFQMRGWWCLHSRCCFFFPLVWKKLYNTNVYETKEHVCSDICCVSLSSEHDECLSGLHNCDENALCFNMVGGHSCSCKPGYTGNGTVCKGKHHHVDSVICCVMLIQVPKQDIKNAVAVVWTMSDVNLRYIENKYFCLLSQVLQ